MKALLSLALILTSSIAMASDSWDTCSSVDGNFIIENGSLTKPEKGEEENYYLKDLVKKRTIRKERETCVLQNAKYRVNSVISNTTYEIWSMGIGESSFDMEFLCNRGGSGIPANDSCNESTVKRKVTFPNFVK